MMKKTLLILGLILSMAGGCAHAGPVPVMEAKAPAVSVPYVFDVIGDDRNTTPWGLKFEPYRKLGALIAADHPAFTLNVGDYTLADTPAEWAAFVDSSKAITDAGPYFLSIGNHEVRDKIMEDAYLQRTHMPGNGKYYAFEAGPALFIVLDSEEPGRLGRVEGDQLAWLKGILASPRSEFKFVFVHRPLFPDEDGDHSLDSMKKDSAEALEAMFVNAGVSAVFAGHCHLYSRKVVDGIQHVITGGGGAPIRIAEKDGGFYEYVRGHVIDASTVSFEVVDINGKVRDSFKVTR